MEHPLKTLALLLALAALPVTAADLTRNKTIVDGDLLYAGDLHELVDLTTIADGFLTGKGAVSTVTNTDTLLLYTTGYRRVTLGTLLYNNTGFYSSQTEKTTAPESDDWLLLYDAGGTAYRRMRADTFLNTNASLIMGQGVVTQMVTPWILMNNGGTNGRADQGRWLTFTNFALLASPTNADLLMVWDSAAATNRTMRLVDLTTNHPAAASLTNGDAWLLYSVATNADNVYGTNPALRLVTYAQLKTAISNDLLASVALTEFKSGNSNLVTNVCVNLSNQLGVLPGMVRAVLVCTNAQWGYLAGDEVDVMSFRESSAGHVCFQTGASLSNVWVVCGDDSPNITVKTNAPATSQTISSANWQVKLYYSK